MNRNDIEIYAEVFAILAKTLQRENTANLESVGKNPLKAIAEYHNDAIVCHLLTEELKDRIGELFAGLSSGAVNAGASELGQEGQEVWKLAYQKALNEMK